MDNYRVFFHYTEGGKAFVDADSREEAEEKVEKHLENSGLNGLDYEGTHREYEIIDVD